MTSDELYKAAAPRKIFIDELETARLEVRGLPYGTEEYTPTLKILISETEIRAKKLLKEQENEAAESFLKLSEKLRNKYGEKGMKEIMDPDEARDWLIAIEEFYMDIGLLEFEEEEKNWVEDRLIEFYKKIER